VSDDVVRSAAEAADLAQAPLIVLEPLEALLDELQIGDGPATATALGDGHSNVTFLLTRDLERVAGVRSPGRRPRLV